MSDRVETEMMKLLMSSGSSNMSLMATDTRLDQSR